MPLNGIRYSISKVAFYLVTLACLLLLNDISFAQPIGLTKNKHLQLKPVANKYFYTDSSHSPIKAFQHSAYIPGWGQIYNHRWWKAPIIYGGLGLLTSAVIYNYSHYKQYLQVYNYYRFPDTGAPGAANYDLYTALKKRGYASNNIEQAANTHQRNMQLSLLGIAGVWGIQMLDAYIDARFIRAYDMDSNVSIKLRPALIPQNSYASNITPLIGAMKATIYY